MKIHEQTKSIQILLCHDKMFSPATFQSRILQPRKISTTLRTCYASTSTTGGCTNPWNQSPVQRHAGHKEGKHTRLQTEITSGYLHFMSHNVTFQLSTSSDPKHMMFKSKPPSFEASMQTAMSLATSGNLASPIQGNHTAKVSVASTNWGLGLILTYSAHFKHFLEEPNHWINQLTCWEKNETRT